MNIPDLRQRQAELNSNCATIIAHAEAEKRDLTDDEKREIENHTKEFDSLEGEIQLKERTQNQADHLAGSNGRQTEPEQVPRTPDDTPVDIQPTNKPVGRQTQPSNGYQPKRLTTFESKAGFRNLGEFAFEVKNACARGGKMDPRLATILNAPTTYGQESSGADGGFAIPPDFRSEILALITGEESLISRTSQITVSGNTFTQPISEETPWASSGIRAYWGGEGDQKTQSKPAIGERTVKLNKIYALVPMTDELLEDAPAMDTYLRRMAPEKINFEISKSILQGDGVGKPLGVLNSPATISIAKETSQVADTIVASNIVKMWSRMYAPSRGKAVWLVNPDVEGQIMRLSLPGVDNVGNAATGYGTQLYVPPGGFSTSPYASLLGRPVIATQAAETLGDKGDIIFADLTQYLTIMKAGGLRTDVSIHLWFDYDITAFRFVMRVGGVPWWSAAMSARDGSATYSPFITLDERS